MECLSKNLPDDIWSFFVYYANLWHASLQFTGGKLAYVVYGFVVTKRTVTQ